MNVEDKRVRLVFDEKAGLGDPSLQLLLQVGVRTVEEDFRDMIGAETRELSVVLDSTEDGVLRAVGESVVLDGRPDSGGCDEQVVVLQEREAANRGVGGQRLRNVASIGSYGKIEDLDTSVVLSGGVDGRAIVRPGQRTLDPAVETSGESLPVAGGDATVGRRNIDGVQLPPVRLVVVLVLLNIGKLGAIRRERRLTRSTLVAGIESLGVWTVESNRRCGASNLTEVDVASGVVGLIELGSFAEESVELAIRRDGVVARITEGLNRSLRPSGSPVDTVVQVAEPRVGKAVAAVRREGTSEDIVTVLGKPGVPVANVDILVEATGVLRCDLSLRVDGSTVGVRHTVHEEVDIPRVCLRNLQTIVRSIE